MSRHSVGDSMRRSTLLVVVLALASLGAPAQGPPCGSPPCGPQLVITGTQVFDGSICVDPTCDGILLISGRNLGDTAPFVGTVKLFIPPAEQDLTVVAFDPVAQNLAAELPDGTLGLPGTFLLTVSTGPSGAETDVFDVALEVTGVVAGPGLMGGGRAGELSLWVDFQGSGAATTAARSDHLHRGEDIVSGTVSESVIDPVITRDDEVLGIVGPQTVNNAELLAMILMLRRCAVDGWRYGDMGDGTVLDCNTGKIWLKDASCVIGGSLPVALSRLAQFNSGTDFGCTDYRPGTYSDWRLPTSAEFCSQCWVILPDIFGFGGQAAPFGDPRCLFPVLFPKPCPPAAATDSIIDTRWSWPYFLIGMPSPHLSNTRGDGRAAQSDPFIHNPAMWDSPPNPPWYWWSRFWTGTPAAVPGSRYVHSLSHGFATYLPKDTDPSNWAWVWPVRDGG